MSARYVSAGPVHHWEVTAIHEPAALCRLQANRYLQPPRARPKGGAPLCVVRASQRYPKDVGAARPDRAHELQAPGCVSTRAGALRHISI